MMRVLFVQLPAPRFSFSDPPSNIPLAAGFMLAALDLSRVNGVRPEILEPDSVDIFGDEGLARAIADRRPSVLALTLYVWNVQRSLFLASNIKRRSPSTKVLIGGPEVTPDNAWVMEHPAVDAGVFGEGESRIGPLLEVLLRGIETVDIPGTFFKTNTGTKTSAQAAAAWDLASCPYPYLDGRVSPSQDGTLFLETVRGCPFRCKYCYYHKAFGHVRPHPHEAVERVLDFAYSAESTVREIYLMDPTFNARRGFRTRLQGMARRRLSKDLAVHTELRADLLSKDDVSSMKEAGLRTAEIGLQSANPEVLHMAGRKGDPEKVAEGMGMLQDAGIEVSVGIILGLPGDTPDGFVDTLTWLKQRGAYSTVLPFVLSVLPGTDFRMRAQELGLKYQSRPPYYVVSTPAFPAHEIGPALLECERILDMEIDYIPPPSLVDRGPGVIADPGLSPSISKWIVDPLRVTQWKKMLPEVAAKASDPLIVWFRGQSARRSEESILELVSELSVRNPHMCLEIVLEFPDPPRHSFLERATERAAQPQVYVNRSFEPLYGEGGVVCPTFTIILPEPGDAEARQRVSAPFLDVATTVWDIRCEDLVNLSRDCLPVLCSLPQNRDEARCESLMQDLQKVFVNDRQEVLFRNQYVQDEWNRRARGIDPASRIPEKILQTA